MSRRPGLLFFAPTAPARTGNGLAMRGWMFLEAYAADYDIDLVILPISGAAEPSVDVMALCRSITVLSPGQFRSPFAGLLRRIGGSKGSSLPSLCRYRIGRVSRILCAMLEEGRHRTVHIQRLYLSPAILPVLERHDRPRLVLDLDDDEAITFDRLSGLHRHRGELRAADAHATEARRFALLTQQLLHRFDAVAVCSEEDARRLGQTVPGSRMVVIPNAPPDVFPSAPQKRDIDLLFVGTFGYLPNRDGAEWLTTAILPRLPAGTRACLVGPCDAPLKRHLERLWPVSITGRVDTVAPYYARARLAVAPLRAGGGTRIKILEAIAFGVPVVSTTLGAEGLPLRHPDHLLLADTPEEFAQACTAPGHMERAGAARKFLMATGSRPLILDRIRTLASGVPAFSP